MSENLVYLAHTIWDSPNTNRSLFLCVLFCCMLYMTRLLLQDTFVGFLNKQEMEATFALVALALSLCHQSHQSSLGAPGQVNSLSSSPQDYWSFEGSVFKAKSEYSTPRSIKIIWMNLMEDVLFRDDTAFEFKLIMESNDINENKFKISVNTKRSF